MGRLMTMVQPPRAEILPITPSVSSDDEERVLRALATNDNNRLDEFVNAHKLELMRYLHHQVGDPHMAEDLTQEVFLRAIRAARAGSFDGRSSVRTWLFQIARNCLTDHARRSIVRRSEPLDEAPP